MWKFCGKQTVRRVLDNSPETLWKLCLSTKFPHQQIRWNYGILHSELRRGCNFAKVIYERNPFHVTDHVTGHFMSFSIPTENIKKFCRAFAKTFSRIVFINLRKELTISDRISWLIARSFVHLFNCLVSFTCFPIKIALVIISLLNTCFLCPPTNIIHSWMTFIVAFAVRFIRWFFDMAFGTLWALVFAANNLSKRTVKDKKSSPNFASHISPLIINFFFSWNHQKISGFLMISWGTDVNYFA